MSSVFTADSAFPMPATTAWVRLRATRATPNPYNPAAPGSDWSAPEELPFVGFLASSSSTVTVNTLDRTVTSRAVMTIPDPDTDIRVGDRVRADPDDGRLWAVAGIPSHDTNPFTGWRPTLEVDLEEVKG